MRTLAKNAGIVAGATLGGLFVGAIEGAYRDAPVVYAALLYGALWSLVGLGVALLVSLLRRRPLASQTTLGLTLSLSLSALALVRFIVFRDVFHEAPGKGVVALLTGVLVATGAAVLVQLGGRWVRHRFLADRMSGAFLWVVPLAALLAFGVRTQMSDEPSSQTAKKPARPLAGKGVILVVVDTLRADALGTYGAPAHRGQPASPRLDAWAKEGAVYTDVSAQASWTRPAVASILTSRHVSGHDTMAKTAVLPAALPTLPSLVQQKGVATAAVVTNYNLEREYGFDRGFDHFEYLAPDRYLGAPEAASRLAAYNAYRLAREKLLTGSREARHFYQSGAAVNARAFDLLDSIGDKDFFLWLHYMEPHDPYFSVDGKSYARVSTPRPPAAWAEDMRAAYKDGVSRFDAHFGELLDGLAARGLDGKVTVVVVSDHGEEFAEHGGFYHGVTLYEEQLKVPLVVRGPGVVAQVVPGLARQIDVAPTILARFGFEAPSTWEGRDLFGSTAWPELTIAEEDHEGNVLKSIRQAQKKLILANPENPRGLKAAELYDLTQDPKEQYSQNAPSDVQKLSDALSERQTLAKKGGAAAGQKAMDADAEAELRSLGYVQ